MPHLLAVLLASPAAWLPGEAGADHILPAQVRLDKFSGDPNLEIIADPVRRPGIYPHNFLGEDVLPQGYTRRCVSRFVDGSCDIEHIIAPDGTDLGSYEGLIAIDRGILSSSSTHALTDFRRVYRANEGRLNADGILVNGMPVFSTYSAPTAACTQEAIAMCVDPAEHCPDVEQTSESQGLWRNTSLTPISTCCTFGYSGDDGPPTKLSGVLEQARFVEYAPHFDPVFINATRSHTEVWAGPFQITVPSGQGPRWQACQTVRRDVVSQEVLVFRCTVLTFEVLRADGCVRDREVGHISSQVYTTYIEVNDVEPPTARVESRPGVTVEEVETFEGRSHALTGIGADPDGDTVTYQWSQAAAVGGARVSIQSPTTARSSFVMPEVRAPGGRAVHTVRLTVTDSVRLSDFHEVRFVVKDTSPPRPHAGFDQQVTVSSTDSAPNRFALDGGLSRDARGGSFTDRLRYTWEEVDGAASNRPVAGGGSLIPGGRAFSVRVTLDVPTTLTTHHFRLTTRDIFTERQAQDWVTVIVRPPAEVEIAVTGTTSIRDGVFTPLPDGGAFEEGAIAPFTVSVPETSIFEDGNISANWRILPTGVNPLEPEDFEVIPGEIAVNGVTVEIREDYIGGTLVLRPGRTRVQLPIRVVDDVLNESTETLTIELSNVQNAANAESALRHVVSVAQSDPIRYFMGLDHAGAPLQYPVVDEDANPQGTPVSVVASLTGPSEGQLIVFARLSGTAIAGTNTEVALSTTGRLTAVFEPFQTSQTYDLNIIDDDETEVGETISLTLEDRFIANVRAGEVSRTPRVGRIGLVTSTVVIAESDFRTTLGFRRDYTLVEGASTQVCVSVSSPPPAEFRPGRNVYVEVAPVFGADEPGVVGGDESTFAAAGDIGAGLAGLRLGPFNNANNGNNLEHCFNLATIEDAVPEDTERLVLRLATTTVATGPEALRTSVADRHVTFQSGLSIVTITDDDPVVIGWEQQFVDIAEGGSATISAVIISPPDSTPIERNPFYLGVGTVAGSAAPGDYTTATAARLGRAFGHDRRRVDFPIRAPGPAGVVDDPLNEAAEAYGIDLVFLDEDLIEDLELDPVTGLLRPVSAEDVDLSYGAVENVVIRASSARAIVRIPQNDPLFVTIIGPAGQVTEGRTAVFSVLMLTPTNPPATAPSQGFVAVTWTVAGVTAGDYTDESALPGLPPGTTLIPPGAPGAQIRLRITDDDEAETAETLTVTLHGVSVGAGGGAVSRIPQAASAAVMLRDKPPLPVPGIAFGAAAPVAENTPANFTATISRAPGTPPDAVLQYTVTQVADATTDTAVARADPNHAPIDNPSGAVAAGGGISVAWTAPSVVSQTAVYFRVVATAAAADYLSSSAAAVYAVNVRDTAPPSAQAGADLAVVEHTTSTLAAVIADPDGDAVTARWSGPPGVVFDDSADPAAVATWTGVTAGTTGGLTLTLTVTDSVGLTATDTLQVVVRSDAAPTARAGDDQTQITGEEITLDGGGSRDARGGGHTGQLRYGWRQTDADGGAFSGPQADRAELASPHAAATTFSAPLLPTTQYFELTVTDTVTMRATTDSVAIALIAPVGRSFSVAAAPRVDEGATLTFTVRIGRTEDVPAPADRISVAWVVTGTGVVTSVAEADFGGTAAGTTFPSGTATIPDGAREVVVAVPTFNDTLDENAETWNVIIRNPQGLGTRLGAVTSQAGVINSSDAASPPPAPVADAGADRSVAEGVVGNDGMLVPATITLAATGTRAAGDTASDFLTFRWTQVSGDFDGAPAIADTDPAAVQLSGADTDRARFTAPNVAASATLVFRFTATAARGGMSTSSSDLVQVTVHDVQPPAADVAADFIEVIEGEVTTLTATAADPDGGAVALAWNLPQQLSSARALTVFNAVTDGASAATTATSVFVWPDIGSGISRSFTLTLVATDAAGLAGADSVVVRVRDNTPPRANPGPDRTVFVGDTVVLDAGNSRSALTTDSTAGLSFLWQQALSEDPRDPVLPEGQFGYVLTSTGTAVTTFVAPDLGADELAFYFRLTVDDLASVSRQSASATVVITVRRRPLPPLSVGAIPAQAVNEGRRVVLAGAAVQDMRFVTSTVAYRWTQTGGAAVQLSGADTANASFVAPDVAAPTDYTFRLTAMASRPGYMDAAASATALVTVNDTEAPVVTLPADIAVAIEGTSATVTGAASDPDGDANLTWSWRQIVPDPNNPRAPRVGIEATTGTAVVTFPDISARLGTQSFTLELAATDSQGLVGADTISVTVRDNSPPTIGPFAVPGTFNPYAESGSFWQNPDRPRVAILNADASRNAAGGRADLVYRWEQIVSNTPAAAAVSGGNPLALTLRNSTSTIASFTPPHYNVVTPVHFRFTVTDTLTQQSSMVQATVRLTPHTAPGAYWVSRNFRRQGGWIPSSYRVNEGARIRVRVPYTGDILFNRVERSVWQQVDRNNTALALPLRDDDPHRIAFGPPPPRPALEPPGPQSGVFGRNDNPATWLDAWFRAPDVSEPTRLYLRYTVVTHHSDDRHISCLTHNGLWTDDGRNCPGLNHDYAPTTGDSRIFTILVNDTEPPVVEAGEAIMVDENEEFRIVSATASDPDGSPLQLEWSQSPSFPPVVFSTDAVLGDEMTAYNVLNPVISVVNIQRGTVGAVTLRLTATDRQGLTGFDEVVVNYRSGAGARASAGPDQTLYAPLEGIVVTLDGSGSLAARDSVDAASRSERLQYSWRQVAADDVNAPAIASTAPAAVLTRLTGADTARPTVLLRAHQGAAPLPRYFRLTVTDSVTGGSDSDVVALVVNPPRVLDVAVLNRQFTPAAISADEGEFRLVLMRLTSGLDHPTTVTVNWEIRPNRVAGRDPAEPEDFCPAAGFRVGNNVFPNNAYPGGPAAFPVGQRQL
ncbi:MAG: hypothetical protein OXU50_03890, partial [Gammaproteobacteria bacterium]|nr:hypothetical protein [Gammaproteobacteria bacterium]